MSVYWYNYQSVRNIPDVQPYPGMEAWRSIYKVFREILTDRVGSVRTPIRITIDPRLAIPNPHAYAVKTFEDCSFERTEELLTLSESLHKPIHFMYSGGIDSTTIAVSFLKHHPYERLKDRLKILTSTEAWIENPEFISNHLVGKFEFIPIRRLEQSCDGRSLVVSGEMNDYYLPNSQLKRLLKGDESRLNKEYSTDLVFEYLTEGSMLPEHARIWTDIFDQGRTGAPIEIRTFEDFLWWIRFNWTRQAYKFLPMSTIDLPAIGICSLDTFDVRIHHFFDSTSFQVWAMMNTDRSPRKNHCRELIRSFGVDDQWVDTKQKFNSLSSAFSLRKLAVALGEDFAPIYTRDELLEHFNPDNDFV